MNSLQISWCIIQRIPSRFRWSSSRLCLHLLLQNHISIHLCRVYQDGFYRYASFLLRCIYDISLSPVKSKHALCWKFLKYYALKDVNYCVRFLLLLTIDLWWNCANICVFSTNLRSDLIKIAICIFHAAICPDISR